jgi:hypothetical protein
VKLVPALCWVAFVVAFWIAVDVWVLHAWPR